MTSRIAAAVLLQMSAAAAFDVAVVTGAGSGIGRATAAAICRRGVRVVGVGRRAAALAETQALCGDGFTAVAADVGTEDGRAAVAAAARASTPRKTLVVHNAAAVGETAPLGALTLGGWRAAMATNVEGPLFLTQALLPGLGAGSRVLHVSSGAAHGGAEGLAAYCASKAALKSVYESLRGELGPAVLVGSAMPGVADTPMQRALVAELPAAHAMRPYFEGLRAETAPAGGAGRPPPAAGLDAPENVAAFFAWLLFDCPADEFVSKDWDIQDAAHHARWAS